MMHPKKLYGSALCLSFCLTLLFMTQVSFAAQGQWDALNLTARLRANGLVFKLNMGAAIDDLTRAFSSTLHIDYRSSGHSYHGHTLFEAIETAGNVQVIMQGKKGQKIYCMYWHPVTGAQIGDSLLNTREARRSEIIGLRRPYNTYLVAEMPKGLLPTICQTKS